MGQSENNKRIPKVRDGLLKLKYLVFYKRLLQEALFRLFQSMLLQKKLTSSAIISVMKYPLLGLLYTGIVVWVGYFISK